MFEECKSMRRSHLDVSKVFSSASTSRTNASWSSERNRLGSVNHNTHMHANLGVNAARHLAPPPPRRAWLLASIITSYLRYADDSFAAPYKLFSDAISLNPQDYFCIQQMQRT